MGIGISPQIQEEDVDMKIALISLELYLYLLTYAVVDRDFFLILGRIMK